MKVLPWQEAQRGVSPFASSAVARNNFGVPSNDLWERCKTSVPKGLELDGNVAFSVYFSRKREACCRGPQDQGACYHNAQHGRIHTSCKKIKESSKQNLSSSQLAKQANVETNTQVNTNEPWLSLIQ